MSAETKRNLIQVKEALTQKYIRLIKIAGSKAKQRKFAVKCMRYQQQAAQLRKSV